MIIEFDYKEVKHSYLFIQDYFKNLYRLNKIGLDSKLEGDLGFTGMDFEQVIFEISEKSNLDIGLINLDKVYYSEGSGVELAILSIPLDILDSIRYVLRIILGKSTKDLFNNFGKLRNKFYGTRKDLTVKQLMIWVLTKKLYERNQVFIKLRTENDI